MNKKWATLASMALAAVMTMSACTSSSPPSDPAPSNSPEASSPAPTSSAEPSESPPAAAIEGLTPASDLSKIPAQAKNRTDTLIIGTEAPKGVFTANYNETVYDAYVVNTLFDSMVRVQKDGTYEPHVADKWEISDDKLTYTFHLNPNVKFSDGTPLTAEDVEFTLTLRHDKSYDGPADIFKANIKGGQAYKDETADSVEGIKVIDPHTIEITTTEVNASALGNIGMAYILAKHYYGKDYSQGNLGYIKDLHHQPLGSGPYILEKYIPGQEVQMKANENYFKGAPKIPNLIYKVTSNDTNLQTVQSGETDTEVQVTVTKDNVDFLNGLGFLDVYMFPTNGYGYIGFNHDRDKFKDKRVRQALTYGLNREEIVMAVYQGYAKVLNIPQSNVSWAYTDDVNKYEYDPEKAKQLLDEAGWVVGSDGIREKNGEKFTIHFVASSPNPVNDVIIPYATENYLELGIEFKPEQMEFNAAQDKRDRGDFDMVFFAWQLTEDPDPTNTFTTTGSQNPFKYSNARVDELAKQGLQVMEIEERRKIYHELYKELNEDPPYIFMYQRNDILPINARATGWDLSSFKRFPFSLHNVEVSQ